MLERGEFECWRGFSCGVFGWGREPDVDVQTAVLGGEGGV